MKNRLKRGVAIVLAVSMMSATGCHKIENPEKVGLKGVADTQSEESGTADDQSAAVYSGNKMVVKRDEILEFDIGCNPWADGDVDKPLFEVYQDAGLKHKVDVNISYDYETGKVAVNPYGYGVGRIRTSGEFIDELSDLQGTYLSDGSEQSWGTLSQYYLVTYIDTTTGEQLEKPELTVLEIDSEIDNAPKVNFSQTDDGMARLYWKDVEGAEQYLVYKLKYSEEEGYDTSATVIGTTDTNEWICEPNTVDYVDEKDVVTSMNLIFAGDAMKDPDYDEEVYIGVIAVDSTGSSAMSNMQEVDTMRATLPFSLDDEDENKEAFINGKADSIMTLPSTVGIEMCNEDTVQKPLVYDFDNCTVTEDGVLEIAAYPDGTQYKTTFRVEDIDKSTYKDELASVKERQDDLFKKGGDTLGPDVTITDDEESPADDAEAETPADAEEEAPADAEEEAPADAEEEAPADAEEECPADDAEDEPQSEEDEPQSEEDEPQSEDEEDKPQVQNDKYEAYGNSDFSKYIASEMLKTNSEINLEKFPEAVDKEALLDAFYEAKNQNPMILGIQALSYNPDDKILYVEYDYDPETTAKKQEEVAAKAQEVVSEIITDGMSDLEKEIAINDYLCKNGEYDDAACENAKKNDFYGVDEEFYDSFTAYGILVNGVGVCASYSADFKVLADAAGLESRIVTGTLEGDLPHAWNKVKIDGQWCIIDPTNNDNDSLKNGLFNLSDEASNGVLVQDDEFVLDNNVGDYAAPDDDKEYYHINNKFFPKEEIASKLAEEIKSEGVATLRTDYDLNENEFYEIAQDVAQQSDSDLSGGYWFGMVYLTNK